MEAKVSPALVVVVLVVVASILVMVYFTMIVKPPPNVAPEAPASAGVAGAPKSLAPAVNRLAPAKATNPLPTANPAVVSKVKDKAAAKASPEVSGPANQLPPRGEPH